jgi:hypothetical protein
MSAVYILASPGLRFLPEAGAIRLLAEKSVVFAGHIFALGFRLRKSEAGTRLCLATSEAGMAAHDEPVRGRREPDPDEPRERRDWRQRWPQRDNGGDLSRWARRPIGRGG